MEYAMAKTGYYNSLTDQTMNSVVKMVLDTMAEDKITFPELADEVIDARAKYDDFSLWYGLAQKGSKDAIVQKNTAKNVLSQAMKTLAIDVNSSAKGDVLKCLATSMPLVRQRGSGPVAELEKPTDVTAVNGKNTGSVKVTVGSAKGADSFMCECTPDPLTDKSVWDSKGGNRMTFTFTGFTSGTRMWFRVAAYGSYGQEMYSDPISLIIL